MGEKNNPMTKKTEKWFALLNQEIQDSLDKDCTFKSQKATERRDGQEDKERRPKNETHRHFSLKHGQMKTIRATSNMVSVKV